MSDSKLDQIVKGAPPPHVTPPQVAHAAGVPTPPQERLTSAKGVRRPSHALPADPTSLLPSSPPQIYLNLLILEASLRSQYLTLRSRRRQNTFVLTVLGGWIFYFTYCLFFRPREDGQGIGGSVYWVVDMTEKVAFIGGIVTLILFWGTGQFERGVRWPRRWIGVTNRGLRGMNCKIVVIRGPWWKEALSYLSLVLPYQVFFPAGSSSYHVIEQPTYASEKHHLHQSHHDPNLHHHHQPAPTMSVEEDIAPGGDYIKLLLLPKPFTPDFRENWEVYRSDYWARENERRAELRARVRRRHRELARQEGGWFWWAGWRGWKRALGWPPHPPAPSSHPSSASDVESRHAGPAGLHPHARNPSLSHTGSLRDKRRRPSLLRDRHPERDGSHSRSSSRSSAISLTLTTTPPLPSGDFPTDLGPYAADRQRRWSNSTAASTASAAAESRRKKKPAPAGQGGVHRAPPRLTPSGSPQPGTPTRGDGGAGFSVGMSKRASTISSASDAGMESDVVVKGEGD